MAQDPEATTQENLDPSHDLDLVTLFSSSNTDAELEAGNIHGVLQASGIPSFILGTAPYPSLEWRVQVPQSALEDAERVLAEARAAGPDAADEAEAASESPQP